MPSNADRLALRCVRQPTGIGKARPDAQLAITPCRIVRSPSKPAEIVADGFEPYDIDFHLDGELFTFDSDNERCVFACTGSSLHTSCRAVTTVG